jgi:hypothetical protein
MSLVAIGFRLIVLLRHVANCCEFDRVRGASLFRQVEPWLWVLSIFAIAGLILLRASTRVKSTFCDVIFCH